jgi:hypothetical protein
MRLITFSYTHVGHKSVFIPDGDIWYMLGIFTLVKYWKK